MHSRILISTGDCPVLLLGKCRFACPGPDSGRSRLAAFVSRRIRRHDAQHDELGGQRS